jgi:hypothetical protein
MHCNNYLGEQKFDDDDPLLKIAWLRIHLEELHFYFFNKAGEWGGVGLTDGIGCAHLWDEWEWL